MSLLLKEVISFFILYLIHFQVFSHWNTLSIIYLHIYLLLTQVTYALLMVGEDLDKNVDVKNILVEMGTYFQVQIILCYRFDLLAFFRDHLDPRMLYVYILPL